MKYSARVCVVLPCVECVCVLVSSSGRYVLELVALFYRMPLEFICQDYLAIILIIVHHNNVHVCVCSVLLHGI